MIESVNLDTWFDSLTIHLKQELNLDECVILLSESTEDKFNDHFTHPLALDPEKLLHLGRYLVKYYDQNLRAKEAVLLSTRLEIESTGLQLDVGVNSWQSISLHSIVYKQFYWGAIALFYPQARQQWSEAELACINSAANHCAIAIYIHLLQQEKEKIVGGLDYTFHECRQPLSAILGLARMLNEQIYGSLNQKQLEYVQAIITSGEHLLSLTNNFLDLAKIEAQKEELFLEKVLVQEVCEASFSLVQESANRKQTSLVLAIEPGINFCIADPLRLRQILVNLLSNGIKYSEKGTVTLKVTKNDQGLYFTVQDTGIGISTENQKKLFQPFAQISNTYNRRQKGTGLGLVLSKNLAILHGGNLTLESEAGKGSCFTLYLPFRH
ncbi:ATP-binding protein [Gloeocapsa sp. PCC 73106]|uniref:sensor histidine kinase n=1 Tax=Gloeocapsa sp. PCC 73106 TaxID=102232 RepID=UPI0002E68A0D|nr:ATP-binding protein [Gloeocapsa sp. PCC 73106]